MQSLCKEVPPVNPANLIPRLLETLQPFQHLLATLSAQGGLASLRGRYTPITLARLDRALADIERVTHELLNNKEWVSLHGRVDHRYVGCHHSMKSSNKKNSNASESKSNILDVLVDIDYD